tara:strand:+ start:332 stop:745 length:414 start_codon:yes stop_codon:yes gene_type:complete
MYKEKKFETISNLLDDNKKNDAQVKLSELRNEFSLHPEYLYLMSRYLRLDNRLYQSIDTLILSIKIDYDLNFLQKKKYKKSTETLLKKKFDMLISGYKLIGNTEMEKVIFQYLEPNKHLEFLEYINKTMPGINIKKK